MSYTPQSNTDTVVIVGGGLAGVTTAYELSARGQAVTLLEAGDAVACGASHANGGMLTPSEAAPWNGPGVGQHLIASLFDPTSTIKLHWKAIPELTRWGLSFLAHSRPQPHSIATRANHALAHYSVARTRELSDQLTLNYDEARHGTMCIYRSSKRLEEAVARLRDLSSQGQTYQVLDRDGVIEVEPQLAHSADTIVGGLYFPDDGSGNARAFTQGLAERAQAHGAIIRTGVRVTGLETDDDGICAIETSEGRIETSRVVLAAGVLSRDLIKPLGLRLPVRPAKGYSLTLGTEGLGNEAPIMPVIDDAAHVAVSRLGNTLRVVGMAEFTGMDDRIDPRRVDQLRGFFSELYPHLADRIDWSNARPWTGLRPMSSDGRPFIGETPVSGLWLNSGHGHLGWTQAVGSAALLVDQMLGETPQIDPTPFQFNRQS